MSALIVHIVYSFRVGGLENGMVNLINRLPRDAYRHVVIALTDYDPQFCQRIKREDVRFIALHKSPGHGAKLFPRLYRLLRELQPDIVHTRNLAALEMSLPAWLARVPVRVHGEHGRDVDDPDGSNRAYQWVRRLYSPCVTQYIALSRDLASYLTHTVRIAGRRVATICNGVDADRFHPAPDGVRERVEGSPFETPSLYVFGTVGRVQAVKDHVGLLRAFGRMRREHGEAVAHARMVIVGDGPLRGDLERCIAEEGLAEVVWLAGERADVAQLMRSFDCFVLPSLAEGISNTVLEAMASGLPVLASRVGGNPELVRDGVDGVLLPAADAAAWAECMAQCAQHGERGRTMGEAARARIEAEFSLSGMVRRYDELYQSLLVRAGRGGTNTI